MSPCPEYKNTLLQDVHGELDSRERDAWEQHLSVCESCRQDKKKLLELIQAAKGTIPPAVLSTEDAHALYRSIERSIQSKRNPWRDALFKSPGTLVPSLVAACLLIILGSWLGLRDSKSPDTSVNIPDLVAEEQYILNNKDLLENLELLQEMDSLEKLVTLLDKQNHETSLPARESKIHHARTRV